MTDAITTAIADGWKLTFEPSGSTRLPIACRAVRFTAAPTPSVQIFAIGSYAGPDILTAMDRAIASAEQVEHTYATRHAPADATRPSLSDLLASRVPPAVTIPPAILRRF